MEGGGGGGVGHSCFEVLFHQIVSRMLTSRHDWEYSSGYHKNITASQSFRKSCNLFKVTGVPALERKTWWPKRVINLSGRGIQLIKKPAPRASTKCVSVCMPQEGPVVMNISKF